MTTITNDWIALEVPHMLEPRVYTGSGKEMYLSGTYQAAERRSGVVYECTTARELASGYGLTINDDAEAQFIGWPCVGAQTACLALVVARGIKRGYRFRVIPRRSTVATAAALATPINPQLTETSMTEDDIVRRNGTDQVIPYPKKKL